MMFPLPLLLLLAACKPGDDGDVVIVAVDNATITLSLRNPTQDAVPTEGVTTMRIDVVANGAVLASESFDYPGGTPELEGIAEYGVVRFEVAGTDGSSVRSYGRSAEVIVAPEEDLWVPITFLPVNRVFALSESMQQPRSQHDSIPLPDGRILLLGGHNPSRNTSFEEVETYDFYEGVFAAPGASLDVGIANAQWSWTGESELLIYGGDNALSGATDGIWIYDPVQDTIQRNGSLIMPRSHHCGAQYIDNSIVILGGAGTGSSADLLRYYTDDQSWSSTLMGIENGGSSEDAVGCGVSDDGRIFIQGVDQGTTGILDPFSGAGIGEGFDSIAASAAGTYVSDAIILEIEPGVFWLGGGIDVQSNTVTSEGQEFRMDAAGFVNSTPLATPRQHASWTEWIEDGWIAVAGGYSDVASRNAVNKVELLAPGLGEKGPTVDLDRDRPGCSIATLPDGALLITGGFDTGTTDPASAAIMVPYIDE
jgi:hypothetical protein